MSTQCTSTRLEQCCAEVMSITMAEATAAMFCITTQGTCLSHLEACNDACISGEVLSCGDGSTGCLGHGDQSDQMIPRLICALSGQRVVQVALGASHTVFLTVDGRLLSCGLCQTAQSWPQEGKMSTVYGGCTSLGQDCCAVREMPWKPPARVQTIDAADQLTLCGRSVHNSIHSKVVQRSWWARA